MAADEVTAPPRRVLIISAGASHSVALLCMSHSSSSTFSLFLSVTEVNDPRNCGIGGV